MISVLGILTPSCAHVPVSTSFPHARIAGILENLNGKFLVTQSTLLDDDLLTLLQAQFPRLTVICTDQYAEKDEAPLHIIDAGDLAAASSTLPEIEIQPNDLAYIIYTSGSTGKPKGVMVEHLGMFNHLFAKVNDLHLTDSSIVVQNSSVSFDISIWQFLSALMVGGTTVVYDEKLIFNPSRLVERLEQDGVTIFEVVPSFLNVLLELLERGKTADLSKLEFLLVTGEALKSNLVERWFMLCPEIPMVNAYGPTEALTIGISGHKIGRAHV